MLDRVEALRTAFKTEFDAYMVAEEKNMLYFSDFLGAAVMLIPHRGESVLYVYSVNYEGARKEAKNCRVELVKREEDLWKKISDEVENQKLKKLGFDAMKVQTFRKLSKVLKGKANLEPKSEYVWSLRRVKDTKEQEKMRKAARLTIEGMHTACETIKPGLREYEVAAEIEHAMRTHGSYGIAFDTIVASGHRSAYPHGGCGERRLNRGDTVVVDFGATYKNYHADMTRTFVVGNPSPRQRRIYDTVKQAQRGALQSIRDGIRALVADKTARAIIEKAGYGEYFVHGLGHGIGLEVHEQPTLNRTSKDVLETGNVVTDEPGVYVVGFGGFRFEDTVLVKRDEAERLTEGFDVLEI